MKRREFLSASGITLGLSGLGISSAAPAFSRAMQRPQLNGGLSSGDITSSGGVIWSRSDRPSQLWVDISREPDFKHYQRFSGGAALEQTHFNAKAYPQGLNPGQQYFYRVQFESLNTPGLFSRSQAGTFKTAPSTRQGIRFCWSGDTAGQGYGIDPAHGGMRTYREMLKRQPDFLIHSGDLIYADGPIPSEIQLPDGKLWRNIQTEGTHKVAETVQEFRENYYYNFLDPQVQEFHSQVPCYQQWDDHEVVNNWYPGEQLLDDKRYTVKSASLLAERSRAAMFQCNPIAEQAHDPRQIYRKQSYGPLLDIFFLDMRSYRGPNSRNRQTVQDASTDFLGDRQLQWLKKSLKESNATWKIIASDMPIGLIVNEWQTDIAENAANGDGPALGRELEIAELLHYVARNSIKNVHFITADVHYCASHYYQPSKAVFKDFEPFWEFVSGPLHAGTFGPSPLDNTFGPETIFQGVPDDLTPNSAPSEGYQFFGEVEINPDSETMTVSHFNRQGKQLWRKTLRPKA